MTVLKMFVEVLATSFGKISKKTKAKIVLVLFLIVTGTGVAMGFSTFAYLTLEHKVPSKNSYNFFQMVDSIKLNEQHAILFISMLLILLLLIVVIIINNADKNTFASEMDAITDKISTPKKIGQFQHGSSRWLLKSEYDKAFSKHVLTDGDEVLSTLSNLALKTINYVNRLKSEIKKEEVNLLDNGVNAESVRAKATQMVIATEKAKREKAALATEAEATQKDENVPIREPTKKADKTKETRLKQFLGKVIFLKTKLLPPKIIPKPKGGLVVSYQKKKHEEHIFCLDKDVHSLILGSTGSSKTRCLILESVCVLGLNGESMVVNDPKGEIYDYTSEFLERLGYEIITLDFRNPLLSSRYNFLQPVITALNNGDEPKAIDIVWDITASLVGETKGERIWHDGEASVIAGSIMSVVFDNRASPNLQNFTNVYNFINYMCRSKGEGEMPLNRYIKDLDDTHPAKSLFGVAELAPSKTRGSFFTSALATLRLFTNPNVYNMTCESDFILEETGNKKRVIYIVLPDEKTTFYSLASLFVYQHYLALVENADNKGGRLDVRTNLILDEYGNFAKIPAFDNMLTVSRGRGIRFNLVVQSFAQIAEKYGDKVAETVKDNCSCLIFLASGSPETLADISKRLGNYTTSSFSRSASMSSNSSNSNNSNSMNLIARPLRTPEEIKMVERPNVLVMYTGFSPAMANLPDLSKWRFNQLLGLGDEFHNTLIRMIRKDRQKARTIGKMALWGIWNTPKYAMGKKEYEEYKKQMLIGSTVAFSQHEGGKNNDEEEEDYEDDGSTFYGR